MSDAQLHGTTRRVIKRAAVESVAIQLYHEERSTTRFQTPERPPYWSELPLGERDVYRRLASDLLAEEFP